MYLFNGRISRIAGDAAQITLNMYMYIENCTYTLLYQLLQ